MTKTYKEGDIVEMKSGSPRMTIGQDHDVRPATMTNVSWYEEGKIHTGQVLTSALRLADSKAPGSRGALRAAMKRRNRKKAKS